MDFCRFLTVCFPTKFNYVAICLRVPKLFLWLTGRLAETHVLCIQIIGLKSIRLPTAHPLEVQSQFDCRSGYIQFMK